jgi:hypothetical protein
LDVTLIFSIAALLPPLSSIDSTPPAARLPVSRTVAKQRYVHVRKPALRSHSGLYIRIQPCEKLKACTPRNPNNACVREQERKENKVAGSLEITAPA